jgi:hypothetical protein
MLPDQRQLLTNQSLKSPTHIQAESPFKKLGSLKYFTCGKPGRPDGTALKSLIKMLRTRI